MRGKRGGFTLLELLIACAVVAILAALVYPSYQSHVRKSARASAQAQMMDIATREQQFLLANRNFVDATQLQASGYALPTDLSTRYTYTIAVASTPPTFTVTFTPLGPQAPDGALTLTSDGTRSPTEKW